jgi:RNA polymerase sigma-70 factor (ECF subfamily)
MDLVGSPSELTRETHLGQSSGARRARFMAPPNEKALPSDPAARGLNRTAEPDRPLETGARSVPYTRSPLDDAMDRYARGEDSLFDEIFRLGAPRVRGFLLRMCSDATLAEDLTQEAFLRIHLARGSFLANAAALPWMYAIARNVLLDQKRRESVRRVARKQATEGATDQASPDARGDEVLAARETLDVVRRTLDELPLIQREAFVLLRFEGLSVREAAEVLGATEGAVKVRAFRAYEALRSALEREGGGSSQRA